MQLKMDEKRRLLPNWHNQLAEELRNIGSIDLTCKATNVLEKTLWISFGLVGIGWFAFFMIGVIEDINPLTSIREDIKLKDVNYPAITICSDSTTKYALAERLGNYIDPNKKLPDKLNPFLTKFIDDTIDSLGSESERGVGITYSSNYIDDCKGEGVKRKYSACKNVEDLVFGYKNLENKTLDQIPCMIIEDVVQLLHHNDMVMADYDIGKLVTDFIYSIVGNFSLTQWADVKGELFQVISEEGHTIRKELQEIDEEKSKCLNKLLSFLIIAEISDWSTNNVGSFFVKSAIMIGLRSEVEHLNDIFRLNENNVSLPDIALLYNVKKFAEFKKLHLMDKLTTPISYTKSTTCDFMDFFCIPSAGERYSSYQDCFDEVWSKTDENEADKFKFNREVKSKKVFQYFPCLQLDEYPSCGEYCSWHRDFIQNISKEKFLLIMSYANSQRKIASDSISLEKKLAGSIFGINSIKDDLDLKHAPTALPIFCHRNDLGFIGDDIGISERVCNDFFPMPSDSGTCLTKNLDIKTILEVKDEYDVLFESKLQHLPEKIANGTTWGKISLILSPYQPTFLPEKDQKSLYSYRFHPKPIKIQLHQDKELASLLQSNTYEAELLALTLEPGHEYTIRVTPYGRRSSDNLKALTIEQRYCKLEEEVAESSIFKTYAEGNCKYECKVKLAIEMCKCAPWDFIHGSLMEECDVFGRTCFYDAMESITIDYQDHCSHCIQGCDYMKYRKEITSKKPIWSEDEGVNEEYFQCSRIGDGGCVGNKAFVEFFYDADGNFINTGFSNYYDNVMNKDNAMNLNYMKNLSSNRAEEMFKNAIIVHLKFMQPEVYFMDAKYTTMDKLAIFGGNFGIFETITGWSFLGMLNLVIVIFKVMMFYFK